MEGDGFVWEEKIGRENEEWGRGRGEQHLRGVIEWPGVEIAQRRRAGA